MRHATNQAVLVLNASFEPLAFCPARRALALIVKDRAMVQEHTGREVCRGILFPSVIRLKSYTYVPPRRQVLSRRNILARDEHTCQYCDRKIPVYELTLDHIVPRSKGGLSTWENLVACCHECNRRKDDLSLEESGMRLRRRPRPATVHTGRHLLRDLAAEDRVWQKYLFYDSTESPLVHRGS